MNEIIKIRNNTLEIEHWNNGYVFTDKNIDIIIHAETIKIGTKDDPTKKPNWLYLGFHNNGNGHIGSIWLNNQCDIDKVNKFIKETKEE